MSTRHQPKRPTAEDWHRVASVLPDTPLMPAADPAPIPAPKQRQPKPPPPPPIPIRHKGPPWTKLTRPAYWILVVIAAYITYMMTGDTIDASTFWYGSGYWTFTLVYMPVAAWRAHTMGYPWWICFAAALPIASLFIFFWLGLVPHANRRPPWGKIVRIGIAAFCAIMAVIIVVAITMNIQPSGANPPNQPGLTVCDTWLRAQLSSSTATPNTNATNDAIKAIQAGRPAQCPPGAWNPVVNDLGRDHLGNIDVKFRTTNTNLLGTAVTMPADGKPRWVYLAETKQWYSSKLDDRSVLATPPTASNQSAPNPTTARPNYTSLPPTTDPMSILMWITEGATGSTGAIGSIGRGLDCDNLLQQQLLASPLATANADNANAVIASIQSQRPSDCPPDTWNPVASTTAGTDTFNVNVPFTLGLAATTTAGPGTAFRNTPWRDNLGNIGIDFMPASTTAVRGSPTTLPLNQGTRWMYLATQGVWYNGRLPANTPAPLLMPTAAAGTLWTAPTSNELQNVVSPTLQTVHTLGIPTLAIIGQVKNVTGRRMGFIQANCQVYVGDIQVASATTFTNSLAPSAKWQYQADLFDDTLQGSNYNIECLFDEW